MKNQMPKVISKNHPLRQEILPIKFTDPDNSFWSLLRNWELINFKKFVEEQELILFHSSETVLQLQVAS